MKVEARVAMRSLMSAILALGVACSALAGQATVVANTSLSGIKVKAKQVLQADANTVWETLTDYNRLATFIPDMVSSRVISAPGTPKRVEQIADAGMFAFIMPDHVVLLMEESPNRVIRFRSVAGKVLAMTGEWQIIGETAPVTLLYHSHVIPLAPLPPLVSDYFVEDEVRKRFEAVGREAERRTKATPRLGGFGRYR